MTFILQLLFQLSRTYSTRCVSRDSRLGTILCTAVVQSLWLVTTALGVKHVNELNWLGISEYMIGGLIGVWISFYIPVPRGKL